jgi:hypothetical protein
VRRSSLVILEFTPCRRNTLRGFASIRLPAFKQTIHAIAVHEQNGRRWVVAMPARPMVENGMLQSLCATPSPRPPRRLSTRLILTLSIIEGGER